MYTVKSTTTLSGFRSHVATTTSHALYCALYEAALDVDIEPDYGKTEEGAYSVVFVCNDEECDAVLESALGCSSRGLVGVA